jgi:hypothetical protein
MLGTVKVCVPELVLEELVACGELGRTEAVAVAVAEGLAAAECLRVGELAGVGDDVGVLVNAAVGDPPARADDPLGAAAGGTVEEFDPLAPHALKPAPQMTAAMITAGTRRILMLLPSVK